MTQNITEGVKVDTSATGGRSQFSTTTDTIAINMVTQVVNEDGSISVGAGYGGQADTYLGVNVSSLGDVNGDGYDDVIVGTSANWSAYVVFGNASGTGYSISGGSLEASQGFKISSSNINFGYGMSAAGDVNGDGFADIAVTGSTETGTNAKTYILYGRANLTNVNVDALTSGTNGYVIDHANINTQYLSVANAGDVNGDGLADMILAPGINTSSGVSTAYVVYGNTSGSNLDLTGGTIAAGRGFKLTAAYLDYIGKTVSGAGDFNGDGYADLIVGADAGNSDNVPNAYIVYGSAQGVDINLTNGLAVSQGFKISGATSSSVGNSVTSAGDINGDGLSDVMVSDERNQAVYVVYGNTGNLANFSVSGGTIASSLGFKISGVPGSLFGYDGASAGDINGDGLSDMIISDPGGVSIGSPSAYVI
jgi:hypothetical protein